MKHSARGTLYCVGAILLVLTSCFERGKERADKKDDLPIVISERASQENTAKKTVAHPLRIKELEGEADDNATIVIALATEPIHLNPILAGDTVAVRIALGDIYETLLVADTPGATPRAGLASRYISKQDGKEWQFFLRSGVRFHNNKPLTAADVMTSFELVASAPGPLRAEFDDLLGVEVVADNSVLFRFSESRSARADAFASVPIVSKMSFEGVDGAALASAPGSRSPVGTGALRFVSHEKGTIKLARFDGYWGQPARAAKIEYRVLADRQRIIAELRNGNVQVAYRLPIDEAILAVEEISGYELFRERLPAYTAAVFNTAKSTLSAELRRGLSESFDRDNVIGQLLHGYSQPALGPYGRKSERADPGVVATTFSLTQSSGLLARLWSPDASPLQLLVPEESRSMRRLADIWISDLRGIVPIDLVLLPFSQLLNRVRSGAFDVTFLSFTTSNEVDLFSLFHSSQVGSSNLSQLNDPSVDALLEQLRNGPNHSTWISSSQTLHRELIELAPFAFLSTDVRLGLTRRNIGGMGDCVERWGARYLWRRK